MGERVHVYAETSAPMRRSTVRTARGVIRTYSQGRRNFAEIKLVDADLSGLDLRGASFLGASLKGANFSESRLTHTQFKGADLEGANFTYCTLNATDLIGASFVRADLYGADLTGAALNRADLSESDLRRASLGNARISDAILNNASCDGIYLSSTNLADTDVSILCDAKIRHGGPSNIDPRTVMKSYRHPRIKRFMLECGVPPLFAEYMIDCARALGEPLIRSLHANHFHQLRRTR